MQTGNAPQWNIVPFPIQNSNVSKTAERLAKLYKHMKLQQDYLPKSTQTQGKPPNAGTPTNAKGWGPLGHLVLHDTVSHSQPQFQKLPNIRLVHAHTKADGGDNDRDLPIHPSLLYLIPLLALQTWHTHTQKKQYFYSIMNYDTNIHGIVCVEAKDKQEQTPGQI